MAVKGDFAVVVSDIHREFPMGDHVVHALRGVSMEVYEGEFIVVLGPSGSGKTTLLNQIGGIDSPTKGEVIVIGRDITKWGRTDLAAYRRNEVGWIFQFFNLIPSLRAWENVGLALEFKGDQKRIKERSYEMLDRVGLGDKTERFPSQLSGGEQQRVAIARALVKNPTIVVADEPTGNLDFVTGQKIADLMHELNREIVAEVDGVERRSTYIVVSHDLSITEKAERVFHLRDGEVASVEEHPHLTRTKKVQND